MLPAMTRRVDTGHEKQNARASTEEHTHHHHPMRHGHHHGQATAQNQILTNCCTRGFLADMDDPSLAPKSAPPDL